MSDSLRPHGLWYDRLPRPSPSPRACSNSSPSSQWCHPTISSSVIPFSCLQPFRVLKTPFSWQPVPPTRKFAQASYPDPSEGRQKKQELQSHSLQDESHNHRKLTKMITWITALRNSLKLWAILGRVTQDGRVLAESSNKTGSTGEGNGKPLQGSCLKNHIIYPKLFHMFVLFLQV